MLREKLVEGPKKDVTGTTKQALIVDGKYRLSVSIVVPVLNEIEVLPYFWESLRGVIEWTAMTDEIRIPARIKEVIFVDGGSTDGTLNFLEDLRSKFNDTDYGFDITILHQPNGTKLAYGEFLGMASANSDLIIKMDGDLQHNPSFIPEMMRNSSGNDIVIAGIGFCSTTLHIFLHRKRRLRFCWNERWVMLEITVHFDDQITIG